MEEVLDIAVLVIAFLAVIVGIVIFFKMGQEEKATTPTSLTKPPVIPKSKLSPSPKKPKTSQPTAKVAEKVKSTK